MIFKLITSKTIYNFCNDHSDDVEIANLKQLGFKFGKEKEVNDADWILNGDKDPEEKNPTLFISSLEELLAFAEKYGDVIINQEGCFLEIYNGYREG